MPAPNAVSGAAPVKMYGGARRRRSTHRRKTHRSRKAHRATRRR